MNDDQRDAEIFRLVSSGETMGAVADKFGLTRETVSIVVKGETFASLFPDVAAGMSRHEKRAAGFLHAHGFKISKS